jgi:hypothetical protein
VVGGLCLVFGRSASRAGGREGLWLWAKVRLSGKDGGLAVGKLADMMSSEADSAGTRAQVGRAASLTLARCWRAMGEAGVSETELEHSDAQGSTELGWGTGEVCRRATETA